jgi:hypothetical protein
MHVLRCAPPSAGLTAPHPNSAAILVTAEGHKLSSGVLRGSVSIRAGCGIPGARVQLLQ